MLLKSLMLEILYKIYKDIAKPRRNYNIASSSHQLEIERVIEYIKNNIDKKIRLEQLAKITNLSPNHFHKIFTESLGITVNKFITELRLKKAKKLLLTSTLNITEIAAKCGYSNISYFSIVFKKHFNISPLDFRKKHSYL